MVRRSWFAIAWLDLSTLGRLFLVLVLVLLLLQKELIVSSSAIEGLAPRDSKGILKLSLLRFCCIEHSILRERLDPDEDVGERWDLSWYCELNHIHWSIVVIHVGEVHYLYLMLFYELLSLLIINLHLVLILWEPDDESMLSEERRVVDHEVGEVSMVVYSLEALDGHHRGRVFVE